MAWYWHRVSPLLEQAHHEAIAVDLPGDDESAGLNDYAEIAVRAIGNQSNVILVAQSLGGFTAPLVCARTLPPSPGSLARSWNHRVDEDEHTDGRTPGP
jgi:pimeloyl-ACP methyl ester carboxylesterase